MKIKNFVFSGIMGIALAGLVLTGCHKNSTTPDTDTTAAEDESNASFASNDTKNISDAGVQGTAIIQYGPVRDGHGVLHCSITKDSTHGVDSVIVDFGATPVKCNDGRYRQGQVIVFWPKKAGKTFYAAYLDSLNTVTMTFKGYAVGSLPSTMNAISGTRTWTNEGHNMAGLENWNFNANLKITYASGGTATWNSTRNNVLTNVGGVWYYEVTGGASGIARNGDAYTLTISNSSPLYHTALPWWLGGCPWIESGIVNITRTGSPNTLTLNFGTLGSCHSTLTATINGNSYTINEW